MRLVAIKTLHEYFITAGRIYDVEEGPTVYDVDFNPHKTAIIIACDDGYSRKLSDNVLGLNLNNFIDLQEVREKKLNELGI